MYPTFKALLKFYLVSEFYLVGKVPTEFKSLSYSTFKKRMK